MEVAVKSLWLPVICIWIIWLHALFVDQFDCFLELERRLKHPICRFGPLWAVFHIAGVVDENAAGLSRVTENYVLSDGLLEDLLLDLKLMEQVFVAVDV